jgi:hypothetical protein
MTLQGGGINEGMYKVGPTMVLYHSCSQKAQPDSAALNVNVQVFTVG